MRTTTLVHSPEERLRMRLLGDRRARMHQVQLWCTVSLMRTALTGVIPLCGSAGWWLAPVCLAPGMMMYGLACLAIRKTGASTLTEAARRALGRGGAVMLSMLLALLLMLDGAASMTALVTGFTEGIGTEGTQITMALLTLLALLFCLHRDGLPWGIHLMRWPMLALAAGAGAVMLTMARADGFHPALGPGLSAVTAAIRAGMAMGWPLTLLATVEPARRGRLRPLLPPVLITCAAVVLVCLMTPCEVLIRPAALAERLLQPAMHLPPALRTLTHALGMLALFLAMATAAQAAAGHALSPWGREVSWLPGLLAAALAATQALPISGLWNTLSVLLAWLPGLLALLVVVMAWRRKACSGE